MKEKMNRSELATKQLLEDVKRSQLAEEKLRQDVKRSQLAEERLLAEITLMQKVDEQLKVDVMQETARATRAEQALERTTAAQADSIVDTTTFIASGVRLSSHSLFIVSGLQ